MPETLCIVDGHAHIYRAFYAHPGLAAAGRPTGAAFGFTLMLDNLLEKLSPEHLVVAFDPPGKNFRHARYPEYKAQRKPAPPELLEQIPLIQDLVAARNIPALVLEGYEADDVIGTLTVRARAAGLEVVIATGDKDCGQLLGPGVRLYVPDRKHEGHRFVDAAAFEETRGIRPEQTPDLFGLAGDASDNIPGVPGVGEKIGAQWLREYGTLERLLERAHEIKGKRGEILRANKDSARLSRELAVIRTDAPLDFNLDDARLRPPDYPRLRTLYHELDFRRPLQKLEERCSAAAVGDGAAETGEPPGAAADYRLVDAPEAFAAFLAALRQCDAFAFDTETRDAEGRPPANVPDPLRQELVGMSFSWADGAGWYLPWRAPPGAPVLGADELAALKPILEDAGVKKYGQNSKFDRLVLRGAGIDLRGVAFDTLVAGGLARAGHGELNLEALAERHLAARGLTGYDDLVGTGRARVSIDQVAIEKTLHYAAEDADLVWRLRPVLAAELEAKGLAELYYGLELPLADLLADMQAAGIRIDAALLTRLSAETGAELELLEEEIHRLAGRAFNVASSQQLATVLFTDMGLKSIRKTPGGKPSTDEDALTDLSAQGVEIAQRLLDHRTLAKLRNTYLDALPALVHPRTGRVHTSFSQTLTATGRLSSREPNLQNIPVRTARGRAVRQAFIPEDGWLMLAADYSQVELRILAHFTEDDALRQAFAEGRDIHRAVAATLAGVSEEAVDKDMRSAAKAVNFGIVYGQSAFGLAQTTGMARGAARRFIDDYFNRFPKVREWLDRTVADARRDGGVRTILGRRRDLPDLAAASQPRRARAEREAVNTVVQGSAADLVKTAMLAVDARMKKETPRARMLLQIHDELLFEAPPEEIDALRALVKETMESALADRLTTPLAVDTGTGPNWLEAK